MKIKFLTVAMIFVLGCALVASGQDKPCPESVTYDRFKDITTEVCVSVFSQSVELTSFSLGVVAQYSGETRRAPIKLIFTMLSAQGQISGFPTPRFQVAKTMYMLADTGRAELSVTVYHQSGNDIQNGHFLAELANIEISPEAINYLFTAKVVEARLGPMEFKFDSEHLKVFQEYLKTLSPLLKTPPRKTLPASRRKTRAQLSVNRQHRIAQLITHRPRA